MTTRFVEPLYEPKRYDDKVEQLTEELAFKIKSMDGMAITMEKQDKLIADLQGELAGIRDRVNLVLMGVRK